MLKDITLGQFFPGNSPLHKLDPRIKILSVIALIVAIFLAENLAAFLFLTLLTILVTAVSRISLKTVLKGLKAVIFIIAFTSILNLFFTKGAGDPLVQFWIITIYPEGIWHASFMIVRITCLIILTSVVLTYTTSPIDLTDGIERLLSPLKYMKVPVHEFAMMMTIAMRFIPTLVEETDKIMNAQKARGVDFSSGGLIKRVKALFPVLIPLFVSAIRRAVELADAMECRCYRGGSGRTRMKVLHLHLWDIVYLSLHAVIIAAILLMNHFLPFGYRL